MAIGSAFTLAASHGSHQHRHHEFKGRKINDLQKWRRGWGTHLAAFGILPCFQHDARKPHEYWRFTDLFAFNLFNSFSRLVSISAKTDTKDTTPNACSSDHAWTRFSSTMFAATTGS